MKTLKIKYLLSALAAFCFAVGVFHSVRAKGQPEVIKKEDVVEVTKVIVEPQDWYFTGDEEADPTNPDNYTDDPNEAPPCELPIETICQIKAPADSLGRPDMEALVEGEDEGVTVAQQIAEALQSLSSPTPSTNTTVRDFRSHN